MIFRLVLMGVLVPVVWWFAYGILRRDNDNWILWIQSGSGSETLMVAWTIIMFSGSAVVLGSIALFAKKSIFGCLAMLVIAYTFAAFLGGGLRSIGAPMTVANFVSFFLALASGFPMMFSRMITGKDSSFKKMEVES